MQQQRELQSAPPGVRRSVRQMEIEQQQRQQELHYRQGIAPPLAHPSDDPGTQGAKARQQQQEAGRQGEEQLRRFEAESRRRAEQERREPSRGEIAPAPAGP